MKLICFDCDSTLSGIEGVDELARLRGPEVHAWTEDLTREAMEGKVRVEDVFGRRLEIIRPRRADAEAVARLYLDAVEPTARSTLSALAARGWTGAIVSGGFTPAIRPLAAFLGIVHLEAVDLHFAADGSYTGYDAEFPTTRSGGKPEILRRLRDEFHPERLIMVGDGMSDLETKPVADLFIGFGRYVEREKVKRESAAFIHSLDALLPLL